MKMAEELLPRLRVADWLDRAEAAQRQLEHLDLRDLRSVVAASDDPLVARDESTRELAAELKAALVTKQDEELALWLGDVEAALDVGRVVRALRLSSQPPKAGVPFPGALATRLAEATTASLQPTDGPDRWSAVLEAAAFSPVRTARRAGRARRRPSPTSCWRRCKRLGPLLPQIAALFGVEVPAERADPEAAAPDARRRDAPKKQAPARPRQPAGSRAGRRAAAGRGAPSAADVEPSHRPRTPPPRRRRRAGGRGRGRGRRGACRRRAATRPSRRARRRSRRRSRPTPTRRRAEAAAVRRRAPTSSPRRSRAVDAPSRSSSRRGRRRRAAASSRSRRSLPRRRAADELRQPRPSRPVEPLPPRRPQRGRRGAADPTDRRGGRGCAARGAPAPSADGRCRARRAES